MEHYQAQDVPYGYDMATVQQLVPSRYPLGFPKRPIPETPKTAVKTPKLIPLICIGSALGLLLIGHLNTGNGTATLQAEINRLQAENSALRGQVNQLQHQLIGIYSAQ